MGLIIVMFSCLTFLITSLGIHYNLQMKCLPQAVMDCYTYGKSNDENKLSSVVKKVLIPKSWFSHFYGFATIYMIIVQILILWKLIFQVQLPDSLCAFSHLFIFSHHYSLELSLLASGLFFLHVFRRLYETLCVNIFSGAKMNVFHYLCGLFHYGGCCTTLLLSGACTVSGATQFNPSCIQVCIGIFLYVFASYSQYATHHTLASLRKDSQQGKKYLIPNGGLFNYVSCPNFLCEVLVYFSLNVIMGFNHLTWDVITVWVLTNQVFSAVMSHKWYKSHFKAYPQSRKAIFPFIL